MLEQSPYSVDSILNAIVACTEESSQGRIHKDIGFLSNSRVVVRTAGFWISYLTTSVIVGGFFSTDIQSTIGYKAYPFRTKFLNAQHHTGHERTIGNTVSFYIGMGGEVAGVITRQNVPNFYKSLDSMFREVLAKLGFGSLDQTCQISLRSFSRSSCPLLCNASHLIIKDLIQILSDLLHGSILNAHTKCLCIREGQEFVGVIGISHGTRSQMLNESRSINCGPVGRHYSSDKLITLGVVATLHHQACNAAVGM